MRDAIVYGYDWDSASAAERIALAIARVGGKVLHCDSVSSVTKKQDGVLHQLEPNLHTFRPRILASRLNRYPVMSKAQGAAVAAQIIRNSQKLSLNKPAFVYVWMGPMLVPVCRAMKEQGYLLVHAYMESFEGSEEEHVRESDVTVVISRTAFHRLRARWDEKIRQVPHGVDLRPFRGLRHCPQQPPLPLSSIPRPRLGYAGANAHGHLNTRVLRELLERRRDWSFISFQWRPAKYGMTPAVPLPNAYLLPWQGPQEFARCVAGFDIGFMPYDCSNTVLYNGPPMKLWDYFALGLPVVATPLIHLWEYEGLVYLGETAKEIERAVENALAEPSDSPLRQKRKELAEKHSVEALGRLLDGILR